jgi:hypothetical protein
MKLNAPAFGATCGLVLGALVCGATVISQKAGKGKTLRALSAPFPGYVVSKKSAALIGLAWGGAYGLAIGLGFALVYNAITGLLTRRS